MNPALDWLTDPFQQILHRSYLQHAFLGGLLVALICAILGVFIVLRGLSLLGDGLGHVSFGGVALGLLYGYNPIIMALAFSIGGALVIHLLRASRIVRGDTAIGILFTAGLSFGIMIVSHNNLNANVSTYLFGTILGANAGELNIVFAVGAGLLVLLGLFQKEFFYMTFSDEGAKVAGLPVGFLNFLFMTLTAASVVVAVRIVGVLIVSALIIIPAASALQVARSFRTAIILSAILGLASVVGGFWLAIDGGYAVGASIAMTACAIFVLAALAKPLLRKRLGA
jgi:zinc transport system permease protein